MAGLWPVGRGRPFIPNLRSKCPTSNFQPSLSHLPLSLNRTRSISYFPFLSFPFSVALLFSPSFPFPKPSSSSSSSSSSHAMPLLSRLPLAPRIPIPSLLHLHSFPRPYGSAAALLDYDYDYDCDCDYYYSYHDHHPHHHGPHSLSQGNHSNHHTLIQQDSNPWNTPWRGLHWVIMGHPTASRHHYAHRLAQLLHLPHISMASLLRQDLNPASPLHKQIANALNQGKLVPEDVIFGLLSKRLEQGCRRGETGFILDGIPRTRMQAEILDQMAEIDLVLNLKCIEGSLSKSTSGNGIYASSQEIQSVATSGFNISVQPQTGHFQSSRVDSDDIWMEKLGMYTEQRKPLEEYYRQQKKLLDFQISGGSGDGEEDAWQGLLAALQLQHIKAANSSHKLTA